VGCHECGDEPLGSGTMELVNLDHIRILTSNGYGANTLS
jgi:hypothetical protein